MLKIDLTKKAGNFPEGWQTVVINDAVDGEWNGKRTVDLFFKDYPDTLKCRIWSATDAKTGEEYGIANLFWWAQAGVTVDGDTATVDDNVNHLKGKTVNVMFYTNDGGYTDIVSKIAPIIGEHFTVDDIESLKASTEKYHSKRKAKAKTNTTETTAAPF